MNADILVQAFRCCILQTLDLQQWVNLNFAWIADKAWVSLVESLWGSTWELRDQEALCLVLIW